MQLKAIIDHVNKLAADKGQPLLLTYGQTESTSSDQTVLTAAVQVASGTEGRSTVMIVRPSLHTYRNAKRKADTEALGNLLYDLLNS